MAVFWQHILAKGSQIGWLELALIPVWAAFIGWLTTWLAIRMIFRPRREHRVLGFRIQGLIHKRQSDLAASIGRTVERHLISREDVLAIIGRPETQAAIGETIDARVQEFVTTKINALHPMIGMFLGGGMREKLQAVLTEEIRGVVPEFMEQLTGRLEGELDFQAIIVNKINLFDMGQLETIIYDIARRELRDIELLCGVLGFAVGVLQVAMMLI